MSQEAHFQDLLDQMLATIEIVPGGDGGMQVQLGDDLAAFIEANPDVMTVVGRLTFLDARAADDLAFFEYILRICSGKTFSDCENKFIPYASKTYPDEWAKMQTNIGKAQLDRLQLVSSENVEQAIARYENTLKSFTSRTHSYDWATRSISIQSI